MAEIIIDQGGRQHSVASNAKANAALTTGIIGTSLSGLMALGGGALNFLGLGNGGNCKNTTEAAAMTTEDLYIERKQANDYLAITKEYYQGRLIDQRELATAFFENYKRENENSFALYKSQRNLADELNQRITDTSFALYKQGRDEKDAINARISELQSKVDVMAAIRPYQDALINCKIDNNALVSDFNLSKRTCRMIEGQLVLPDSPTVTGFTSYYPCYQSQ